MANDAKPAPSAIRWARWKYPLTHIMGASTQRAVLNFPISDLRFPRRFIQALGLIKQKAAEANLELGLLDEGLADAIMSRRPRKWRTVCWMASSCSISFKPAPAPQPI